MDPTTFSGPHLPLSSLRLLVPPLRLMSASMWQVAQQRNVMQYGKLEEFVTLVTEMVPELLTLKQRVQLILGLRARLVLELCRGVESNPAGYKTIQPHLDRIHSCTTHKGSEDKEVESSKDNFVELVQTLLEDSMKREHFFQEVFPVQYSTRYDTALQILVWQFFDRLEEMMPVPSFTQTASILNLTPTDLEECQQSFSDPEHLKTLLQHHRNLGHLKKDFLFYDSDNILSTLSFLAPSLKSKHTKRGIEEGMVKNESDVRRKGEKEEAEGLKEQESGEEGQQEVSGEDQDASEGSDEGAERLEEAGESSGNSGQQKQPSLVAINGQAKAKPPQSQGFSCSQCQFSNRRWLTLQKHIKKNHPKEDSGIVDSGEAGAENNVLPVSETESSSAKKTRKNRYICSQCGKGHKCSYELRRHETVHSEVKPFHCDQCEKRYKTKVALKQHHRVHTGERPYVCSHCGRGFRSAGTLQSHVRTHTGERPFVCSICGKGFIQHQILIGHLRWHRGEKPFLCTVCGKSFSTSGALLVHSRTHTDERPKSCEHCGKRFRRCYDLTIHRRIHTGERPFSCTQCDKCFTSHSDLSRHMRIHTGEKPYQCKMCDRRFTESGNLKVHQRVHRGTATNVRVSVCNISTTHHKSPSVARKKERKNDNVPPLLVGQELP
ncbi:zinc finger protein 239 [Oncorhynchus kisutch]|uniref:Zinc finger protein 239 n=1 Tax=Oncorhynchus kisutch TaxID=8019 RepID=A0A8C7I3A5_ONCKI|nr:zinc finger protein 239 [Oncorhynchus kisutch]